MARAYRANSFLALLLGTSLSAIACSNSYGPSYTATSGDTGGTGGNTGGAGGSATGGIGGSTSAGGSGGGTAGRSGSTGGSGGGGAGGSGGTTGSGGAGAGGSAGSGSGGVSGSGGSTRPSRDAGPDGGRADVPRLGQRDALGSDVPDASSVPDATAGDAACPAGQAECSGSCVDISSSTSHCGGCTDTCGSKQACIDGVCVEGGSTSGDGCTDELAHNLTLQQISVYQTVEIPVMQDGAEVSTASRNADVVEGRSTMFRAFVATGTGWTARDLAARLTLTTMDGQSQSFYSKKTISGTSTESDMSNTFDIFVPADAMAGTLSYSLSVVECSTQSGSSGQARFPTDGTTDLGVRTTGGLKIKIIPIEVDNLTPDTSDAALAGYEDEMTAMYPIDNISMTVGDTLTTTSPVDWSNMLDQIRAKRSSDRPAADIYYFGMVKPADTLRTYCRSSCTTGIGYVVSSATGGSAAAGRAAVGIGFGDKASYDTMAHEVGHYHGRNLSPCSTARTITRVDPNYPYPNAQLGSWGYDARTQKLMDPTKYTDIMGYCNNQWMSDYTYQGILTRVAAVNGTSMEYTPPQALARWWILYVDEQGARWGIPYTDEVPALGAPETATIYDDTGAFLADVTVYRTAIGDVNASMYMVPEPQPGWYAIQVAGAAALPFSAPVPTRWPVKKR